MTWFTRFRCSYPQVNVDNNCVGFYQSMYLGSFCTQTLIDNQFSYQVQYVRNLECHLWPNRASNLYMFYIAASRCKFFARSFHKVLCRFENA